MRHLRSFGPSVRWLQVCSLLAVLMFSPAMLPFETVAKNIQGQLCYEESNSPLELLLHALGIKQYAPVDEDGDNDHHDSAKVFPLLLSKTISAGLAATDLPYSLPLYKWPVSCGHTLVLEEPPCHFSA